MFKRRKQETFNLAFLDVMSCGLGAILMIFLIVKHNISTQVQDLTEITPVLESLQGQQQTITAAIEAVEEDIKQAKSRNNQTGQAIGQTQDDITALEAISAAQKSERDRLKRQIEAMARPETTAVPKTDQVKQEQHLIGLRVEGDRIAILVDHSASMTDAKLVDIIKRKIGTDSIKKAGPKWQRTRDIVAWLLSRLPGRGRVTVIGYNDRAGPIGTANWLNAADKAGLTDIMSNLNRIVPQKATNLGAALARLRLMSPLPTDVYLITDGLPTSGRTGFSISKVLKGCSNGKTITGKCRLKLFHREIQNNPLPYGMKLNVILLPIEGDPEATPAYWRWAAETGGMLITPGEDWP